MLREYIVILVRGKKDRDVIKHILEKYYRGWESFIRIDTFSERSINAIIDKINNLENKDKVYILGLLGRDDIREGYITLRRILLKYPNISILRLRTSKVRNMRPLEIFVNIEKCKADIRLRIFWTNKARAYVLGSYNHIYDSCTNIIDRLHPMYDVFLGLGREFIENIENIIKDIHINSNTILIVKRLHDEHDIYLGNRKICEIVFPENEAPYVKSIRKPSISNARVSIDNSIKLSSNFIKVHEKIATSFIREIFEIYNFDRVVVPWSGGKDSTVCLLLALKAVGKDNVVPVFIDMGLEFNINRLYIKLVSELLKIDIYQGQVDLLSELNRRELPTHEARWCTKLKIRELYRIIKKISDRPLVVVGDRDNESLLRLARPPFRKHEWISQIAPIKLWSSVMVQFYLLMNRIPINPLYMLGFYRLGCYICPAYRVYELDIAEKILKIDDYDTFRNLLQEQSYLID